MKENAGGMDILLQLHRSIEEKRLECIIIRSTADDEVYDAFLEGKIEAYEDAMRAIEKILLGR